MPSVRHLISLFALIGMTTIGAITVGVPLGRPVSAGDAEPPKVDFRRDIRPILEAKCYRCHGGTKKEGDLDMTSREGLLKGGNSGPALVPGNVEKSLMVELIEFEEMPPRKEKQPVTKEEFAKLAAWIKAKAPMPN
jgi:cytochrome c